MFGDGSRIRKVAVVENGVAMLHKALVEMALGLPNVLFAAFFAFNEIDKVFAFTVQGFMYVHVFFFFHENCFYIFVHVPGFSGMFRNAPCSWFYDIDAPPLHNLFFFTARLFFRLRIGTAGTM